MLGLKLTTILILGYLIIQPSFAGELAPSALLMHHFQALPDYTKRSSPACQKIYEPEKLDRSWEVRDCSAINHFKPNANREKGFSDLLAENLVSGQEIAKKIRNVLALRAAENGMKQHALGKALGVDSEFWNQFSKATQCPELGELKSEFGDLKQRYMEMSSSSSMQASAINRDLMYKRVALALMQNALVKGKIGLANPTVNAQEQLSLDQMKLLYPELNLPKATEWGQSLWLEHFPKDTRTQQSPLVGGVLESSPSGVSASSMRALSYSNERDQGGYDARVQRYLFESVGNRGWAESGVKNEFSSSSSRGLLNQAANHLLSNPISSTTERIVRGAVAQVATDAAGAIEKLCRASLCELMTVNKAVSVAVLESYPSEKLKKAAAKRVCDTCAKDDTSDFSKFWAHYGAYFEIGVDTLAVGACVLAPPWGCVPVVGLGVKSTAGYAGQFYSAYRDLAAYESYISASLLNSPQDFGKYNEATKSVWTSAFMATVFAATTAAGGAEAIEAFREAGHVADGALHVHKFLNRGLTEGNPIRALEPKSLMNPTIRKELAEIAEFVKDHPESVALVVENFLAREGRQVARFANPAELARASSLPQRVDVIKSGHGLVHGAHDSDKENGHRLHLNRGQALPAAPNPATPRSGK